MDDAELTPREIAEELGVTVRTVQRWVTSGRLPATRLGGRLRVSRSSLALLATDPVTSAPPAERRERAMAGSRIRTLLIANRGEVAARIARTARRRGIRAVGVHETGDGPAARVDEAHEIGSYLDGAAVVHAARAAGADAVHPGYGFLAENPEFAAAVTDAGLAWIGPPPEAIRAMGDKAAARRHAARLGVPVVPGYDGPAQDDRTLAAEARRIGLPVLVKPSAGGGGKGMRVVRDPDALPDELAAARREARRAFGDDRLILERALETPRHVEVQVLFDAHGNGVHLGERDCSAQRRNQKIVEETPAPSVTPELRERMTDAALRLAASVGYVSAGTVEMLVTDAGDFFFLEMNTRLQVEHPVTESVTGRDLVADQIRIAEGATLAELGLSAPPQPVGHAIEARLYAEDPEHGFLPATGHLARIEWPAGVRIDTGVEQGDEVGGRYDPMLAKIVANGRDRDEAVERLASALDATRVLGVRTNLRFLRWLLTTREMRAGEMRTDTLATIALPAPAEPGDEHWQAASRALAATADVWGGGWRLNAPSSLRLRQEETERSVAVPAGSEAGVRAAVALDGDAVHVDVEGQSLAFSLAPPPSADEVEHRASGAAGGASTRLTAPMPGRVSAIRVAEGDAVEARATVMVLEAMKMEHAIGASVEGRVTHLHVAEGAQVERGALLAEIEPYDATDDDG